MWFLLSHSELFFLRLKGIKCLKKKKKESLSKLKHNFVLMKPEKSSCFTFLYFINKLIVILTSLYTPFDSLQAGKKKKEWRFTLLKTDKMNKFMQFQIETL